jgi:hypothetical protein
MIDHVDYLWVGLDGNADATLGITGDLSGQISSGNITLFQVGIPGFSIPKYVAADPRPHAMDSSSRPIVESLK